jgi:anti-sigma-D factor RsdA-like protein
MPDDRNGIPPGPPNPFGGEGRGANGVRPDGVGPGPVDLPTRPLPVDVADGPIDLVAVQADDELVNALGTGAAVTYGDRGPRSDPDHRRPRDERLVTMLAAWRAEIEAEPIPELVDLDTAVAAVAAGMKADEVGTRRRRADRLRHLAPLAAAAAIIVATISGVGLGSQDAMPGDTLWPIHKVVDPERAGSVEAKIAIEGRLQVVRVALATGDTETAARELDAISTEIPAVLSEDGQSLLLQEQEFLTLKLAETPPGTPADLSTPPTSDPSALSTTAAAPPPPASAPTDPSQLVVGPNDPSVSQPVDPDPRTPSEALVPAPASESGSEGPTTPGSGSSEPEVTKEPTESAPQSTEGGADETTAPSPSGADQPASEGGASLPASDGAQDGATSTDTTASGSAGTSIDATGTATAS